MGATNGHGKHDKGFEATSHEYDALRRDIKAIRDTQVSDLETLATKIHASREHSDKAIAKLAGQVLGLHQANIANVNELGTKLDTLSVALLAHIEADAEWKAAFRQRLAAEHDRTSEIERIVDTPIPGAHVLGLKASTWRQVGTIAAAAAVATIISACAIRAGVLAPPSRDAETIQPIRQNTEGP